jgi:hypothetical protein
MSSYAIDGASSNLTKLNDYPVGKNPTGSRSSACRIQEHDRVGGLRTSREQR